MKRNMIIMGLIASFLFAGNAFCADWKYYGGFTSAPDTEEVLFYDASSITKTNDSIKLWVKSVLYNDIKKILGNKSIVEKAAKKVATGYKPPIAKIYPESTNAAYMEEAANDPTAKTKAEISYQIMCTEKKFRKISGAALNKDGVPEQLIGISEWEEIGSGSNADNLAKIVCGSK